MRLKGGFSFLGAIASALAFVINVVFFCHKRKHDGSDKAPEHDRRRQKHARRHASEQEALLANGPSTGSDSGSSCAVPDSRTDSVQAAVPNTTSAQPAVSKPTPVPVGKGACEPSQLDRVDSPELAAVLDPADVSTDFLQNLIDAELGPPKFAVAKQQSTQKPASHSRTPPSLEALLAQELGPPKFAVAKSSGSGSPSSPVLASEEAVSTGAATDSAACISTITHHLRLEVTAGPATGTVFDTVDKTVEVRIGRLPDCSLSLAQDHEVSSKHATIHYSSTDQCWKMMDVGSLNGSSINGVALSSNRQPSTAAPLTSGDMLALGSVTRVMVTCTPSHTPRSESGAAASTPGPSAPSLRSLPPLVATTNKLNDSSSATVPGLPSASSGGAGLGSSAVPGRATVGAGYDVRRAGITSQMAHTLSMVGPPLAVRHHGELGLSLAVQQRLGTDHKRTNTGCEDVAHWEVPWSEAGGSALLAIFDGHQGVRAAAKAKEVLPQLLRERLEASGSPSSLVCGRTASAQSALLHQLFLDTDTAISLDEGCTATVLMLDRDSQTGAYMLQSANVGDSSAVLVQLPVTSVPTGHAPATPSTSQSCPEGSREQGSGTVPSAPTSTTAASSNPPASATDSAPAPDKERQLSHGTTSTSHPAPPAHTTPYTNGGITHVPLLGSPAPAPVSPFTPPPGTEGGGLEGGGHWVKLSEDHRISGNAKERERLAGLGHKTVRTRLYGLNISRMLGDKFLKDEALGFIADPHISPRVCVAQPGGDVVLCPTEAQGTGEAVAAAAVGARSQQQSSVEHGSGSGTGSVQQGPGSRTFVVLASDGLWDVVSESKAAQHLARAVSQDPDVVSALLSVSSPRARSAVLHVYRAETSVVELAGLLLAQAVTARSKDDITVMVMELFSQ